MPYILNWLHKLANNIIPRQILSVLFLRLKTAVRLQNLWGGKRLDFAKKKKNL